MYSPHSLHRWLCIKYQINIIYKENVNTDKCGLTGLSLSSGCQQNCQLRMVAQCNKWFLGYAHTIIWYLNHIKPINEKFWINPRVLVLLTSKVIGKNIVLSTCLAWSLSIYYVRHLYSRSIAKKGDWVNENLSQQTIFLATTME